MNKLNSWRDFSETFTEDQRKALWQYLIDHSRIQNNGYLGIMFYVKDMDDFWRRVYARYNGDFKRYDILEKGDRMAKTSFAVQQKIATKRSKIIGQIIKNGSFSKKIAFFFYRKLKKYIFGERRK